MSPQPLTSSHEPDLFANCLKKAPESSFEEIAETVFYMPLLFGFEADQPDQSATY